MPRSARSAVRRARVRGRREAARPILSDSSLPFGAVGIDRVLDVEQASMRRTASNASGKITAVVLPCARRRAFAARLAI